MALEPEEAGKSTNSLLNALEKLSPLLKDREEDMEFLKNYVRSNDFQKIMEVHSMVKHVKRTESVNQEDDSLTLSHMVSYDMERQTTRECTDLLDLLKLPHINCVLAAYDKVVHKEYPLQSIKPEDIIRSVENNHVLTVRVKKGSRQKLGATVKADAAGNILIGRIMHGSVANRCGLLHSGDVVHEINKISMAGKSIDDVGDLMKELEGLIEFKLSPSQHTFVPQHRKQDVKHMKALFSYKPSEDRYLPCEEAGLKFEERQILSVFNQEDPEYWQATHGGENSNDVGLIPSAKMRERMYYNEANSRKNQAPNQQRGRTKKEIEYNPLDSEELGGREVLAYEEVVEINPQLSHPRPIVLVAPKCGPFDLTKVKYNLVTGDPNRFSGAVPHTSRPRRTGEVNGKHYHFVSKEEMKQKIASNELLEHGEMGGHYYGLAIDTIQSVINQGKVGLLTIVPRALKVIHFNGKVRAHIVFFEPPKEDSLDQDWLKPGLAKKNNMPAIQRETETMISLYGRYFDTVIPYCNLEKACIEVQRIAHSLMTESQWVPKSWVETS